jgi:hypothetical protein
LHEIVISIPLDLEPMERGERFDLPLCELFDETDGGDVVGGGTAIKQGEIQFVEIEIELLDLKLLPRVAKVLLEGKAPPETAIHIKSPSERTVFLRDFVDGVG